MKDLKENFWSDAAKAGLILGGVLFIFSLVSVLFKLDISHGWITSLFNFTAIAVCVYVFGKKRADLHGDMPYTFGQSISFILAMSLCAGFVVGAGTYVIYNIIAPEYYQQIIDYTLSKSGLDMDSPTFEQGMSIAAKLMRSVWFSVFSGVFNMLIYGCFIGLVASIFLKKEGNPFNTETNEQ